MAGPDITLVRLSVPIMEALVRGDLEEASSLAGIDLGQYFLDEAWLWRLRLAQVADEPRSLDWIARAAVDRSPGVVVGHVGFHGPPDDRAMVEVAYAVAPQFRRRGYATAMLARALEWAGGTGEVRVVRASVSPDNEGSLAIVRRFGFERVGEQWDEEDGLELLFELPLGD